MEAVFEQYAQEGLEKFDWSKTYEFVEFGDYTAQDVIEGGASLIGVWVEDEEGTAYQVACTFESASGAGEDEWPDLITVSVDVVRKVTYEKDETVMQLMEVPQGLYLQIKPTHISTVWTQVTGEETKLIEPKGKS